MTDSGKLIWIYIHISIISLFIIIVYCSVKKIFRVVRKGGCKDHNNILLYVWQSMFNAHLIIGRSSFNWKSFIFYFIIVHQYNTQD